MALLLDGVFQGFTGLELGDPGGFDFNRFAGLGVAACTGGAVGSLERAESDKRHGLLLFQARGDGCQCSIDRAGGGCFGEVGGFGDGFDQILFVHEGPLSLLVNSKRNACRRLYSKPDQFGQADS